MLWWRGQRLIRDSITDGEFRKYGLQVASMMEEDPEDRIDPMSRIFPRMTKCTFRKVHKRLKTRLVTRLDRPLVIRFAQKMNFTHN